MNKTAKKSEKPDKWELCLYVAGQTPKSKLAICNLRKLCENCLAGKYRIEVIDILDNPQVAKDDQIIAIPTVVRKLPLPLRKTIGNISNTERVLKGLDIPC